MFCLAVPALAKAQQPVTNPNNGRDTSYKSIPAVARGTIGPVTVTVEYASPRVRNRIIWGGVVPFDQVWVSGAHMATRITFSAPCRMGKQRIEAGTYAFYTLPGPKEWTVILNKNYRQHLADNYDQKLDVLRLAVTPRSSKNHRERLQYFIEDSKLILAWERLEIEVPLTAEKK